MLDRLAKGTSAVRQLFRMLVLARGYAALSVVTLALGIAGMMSFISLYLAVHASTSTFEPTGVVFKVGPQTNGDAVGGLAPIQIHAIRNSPGVGALGIAERAPSPANVSARDDLYTASALASNARYLELLAGKPALGSFINDADPDGVMISEGFWRKAFSASPNVLKTTIKINGLSRHIIGVLPRAVPIHGSDVVVPLARNVLEGTQWAGSYDTIFQASASVDPLVILSAIRLPLQALDMSLPGAAAAEPTPYSIQNYKDAVVEASGGADAIRTLGLCALLLLILSVVNLTNLAVLRFSSRSQEIAVRIALGANRLQLFLSTCSEGITIGISGASIGVVLATLTVGVIRRAGTAAWPWVQNAQVITTLGVALTAGMSVLIPLFVGLAGLHLSGSSDIRGLMGSGARAGAGRLASLIGRTLVVAQMSLATLLLAMAFLFGHSLWRASHVDYGLDLARTASFAIYPDKVRFPDANAVKMLAESIRNGLSSEPGISEAAYATDVPGGTAHRYSSLMGVGGRTYRTSLLVMASPNYLSSLGLSNVHQTNDGVTVSSSFARRWFPDGADGGMLVLPYSAIDKLVADQPMVIGGVARDSLYAGGLSPIPNAVWFPFNASTAKLYEIIRGTNYLYFVLHYQGGIEIARQAVASALQRAAPGLPFTEFRQVSDYYSDELEARRMNAFLLVAFAILAVVMATVGLYSVMSVAVQSRVHEFGVKAALGATRRDILLGALGEAGVQVLWGCGFGLIAALLGSGVTQHYLYGVSAVDPIVLVGVVFVLSLTGLAAAILPARKAAEVAPVEALRTW